MTTHEAKADDHTVEPGSDRSFGLIVGGVIVAVAAYQWWSGVPMYRWFGAVGVTLMLLGLTVPAVLHPLNVGWTKLGLALGRIVTPLVMLLVYVVSVVPIGLLLRLFGKDLLGLARREDADSYWKPRCPPGPPPASLKDQF